MNNHRRAVIGGWVCVATIVGGGYLGVAGWPDVAGLAAHSVQAIRGDATVRSNSPGRLSATNTYQSDNDLAAVVSRYQGRYQLEAGRPKAGQCVLMRRMQRWLWLRQSELVTLCPSATGTRISLHNELYLGP